MSELKLIKINGTGIIPIINEENVEYAMVSPRIYKALLNLLANPLLVF